MINSREEFVKRYQYIISNTSNSRPFISIYFFKDDVDLLEYYANPKYFTRLDDTMREFDE